jgi:hypothetical protein
MTSKDGIAQWSKLYGRQITEEDYQEICDNLSGFFGLLHEGNKGMYKDRLADIRNKLQPAVTVLESLKQGKSASSEMIDAALNDLGDILKLIDRDEVI